MGSFDRRYLRRRHSHPLHIPHVRAFVRLQESRGSTSPVSTTFQIAADFVYFNADLVIAGAKVSHRSGTHGSMLCC